MLDVEFSIVATEGPAQASPAEAAFQIELAIARWQPGAELRLGLARALAHRAAGSAGSARRTERELAGKKVPNAKHSPERLSGTHKGKT